jgi:hypothetical protein
MDQFELKTDLRGKINNLDDFKSEALTPVFEAIINSIDAIEERTDIPEGQINKKGEIKVKIIRDSTIGSSFDDFSSDSDTPAKKSREEPRIKEFQIEDNGVGFNPDNFLSFQKSDSTYKLSRGGKGLGRFSWLKAFDKVEITSVYRIKNSPESEEKTYERKFIFNDIKFIEKHHEREVAGKTQRKTLIRLIGFKEKYRNEKSAFKTTDKIAQRIFEHCLAYYIGKIAPNIIVQDGAKKIYLDTFYNDIKDSIFTEPVLIKEHPFTISHIKLYDTHEKEHKLVFCARNRDVIFENLSKYLGTSAQIQDNDRSFVYTVYVSGKYLSDYVNDTRTDFNIPKETKTYYLDPARSLSLDAIRDAVLERANEYLLQYLTVIQDKKKEIVSDLVKSNPQLRSVPKYYPEVYKEFETTERPEKIFEKLYKFKGMAEWDIQKNTTDLLKTQSTSLEKLREEFAKNWERISETNRDQLAGYMLYRKMILDLIQSKIEWDKQGKFETEDVIHDLIFPRKTTSDDLSIDDYHLWLIDERLTYHELAISDEELKKYSSSKSKNRGDVVVFSEVDDDGVARSVSIIELKRPKREKFDKNNPVSQMYEIIEKIENQTINRPNGRDFYIDKAKTKFYCYAVCDITDEIKSAIRSYDMRELKNNMGYYCYNDSHNAYVEILNFDKLIVDAKRRHKIFFEKLGLPMK